MKKYVLIEKLRVKKCSKCNEIYPATLEFFQKLKNSKYNLRPDCKCCSNKNIKFNSEFKNFYNFFYKKNLIASLSKEKKCTLCNETFHNTVEFFSIRNKSKNTLRSDCRQCCKNRNKKYYENDLTKSKLDRKKHYKNNKKKYNDLNKQWRENNKKTVIEYRKEYRKNPDNLKKINKYKREYDKKKRENNSLYKLITSIRHSVSESIKRKGYTKKSKTYKILGCTFEEFKIHIEKQFLSWMSWENYGKYTGKLNSGWDLDHIIPVSSSFTEGDVIKLNHYTNFQPLCSKINRDIKRDKKNFKLEFQAN